MNARADLPKRARAAEAALVGKPWNEASVQAALAAMTQDFTPMTDQRASTAYRMKVAQNLLLKFYLETSGGGDATRVLELAAHG